MQFWPLFRVIVETGYYATWRYHWYVPVAATILVMLLLWATSFGVVGIVVGSLLTLAVSPLLFVIGQFLVMRFR